MSLAEPCVRISHVPILTVRSPAMVSAPGTPIYAFKKHNFLFCNIIYPIKITLNCQRSSFSTLNSVPGTFVWHFFCNTIVLFFVFMRVFHAAISASPFISTAEALINATANFWPFKGYITEQSHTASWDSWDKAYADKIRGNLQDIINPLLP